jgi:hypothetical protein
MKAYALVAAAGALHVRQYISSSVCAGDAKYVCSTDLNAGSVSSYSHKTHELCAALLKPEGYEFAACTSGASGCPDASECRCHGESVLKFAAVGECSHGETFGEHSMSYMLVEGTVADDAGCVATGADVGLGRACNTWPTPIDKATEESMTQDENAFVQRGMAGVYSLLSAEAHVSVAGSSHRVAVSMPKSKPVLLQGEIALSMADTYEELHNLPDHFVHKDGKTITEDWHHEYAPFHTMPGGKHKVDESSAVALCSSALFALALW